MQLIVLISLFLVCSVEYAVKTFRLPGIIKYIPEMISGLIMIYVVFAGVRQNFRLIPAKYWLVFGALVLIIISGVLINDVGTGPLLAGMRYYLRAIPFFFLPAVANFSDKQIRNQLRLLMGIAILQFPFAFYERFVVWQSGRSSGDSVVGILNHSGVLSIFLVCCVLLLTGMRLRRQISLMRYTILFFVLLLPTAINETKVTVLIIPLGFFVVLMIGSPPGKRLRVGISTLILLAMFGAVFVPVYNLLQENSPTKKDIVDFFSDPTQINRYLSTKSANIGTEKPVGRTDAFKIPVQYLAKDPLKLLFGLGLGNVTHSEMGENFTGRYYDFLKSFLITSFTIFILEIGSLGCVLVMLLYWMVLSDSLAVARRDDGLLGALALGWAGVVVVMVFTTFYITIHAFDPLSYVYWYMSGIFVAHRAKLELATIRR